MLVLPVKFESILRGGKFDYGPLILPVESDLAIFNKLYRFNMGQDAGSLCIIHNPPGQGKTTAVYAASVLLRDKYNAVLAIPPMHSLDLRDIPKWLRENLPPPQNDKITPILIDGREATDDSQGLRDLMGTLNNLVRGRPDLLFIWPTTSANWRDDLVAAARGFGSQSFCPSEGVFSVEGPGRERWVEAVGLILEQLGSSWDEFGINESSASEIVDEYQTLGDFFTAINKIRTDQEELAETASGLPEVVFVVSSHSDVVGHVARLRNPVTYRVRTDELIGSARQSAAGKFWRERGKLQKQNLAWVSSLMQVKLIALTPSTVAHACGLESPPDSKLKKAMAQLDFKPARGTGNTAYRTTDLARFLAGEPVPEVLSSNKGKTSTSTLEAFDLVQSMSAKNHKIINQSILSFAGQADGTFNPEDVQYELALGGDAIVDALVPVAGRRVHFEFHHLSGARCSSNSIASYIMRKLKVYAIQYQLVGR